MDRQQGVLGIVVAAQHQTELEVFEAPGELLQLLLYVRQRGLVGLAARELFELFQIVELRVDLLDGVEPDAVSLGLFQRAAGAGLVIPESFRRHAFLESLEPGLQPWQIKDTP